MNLGYGARYLDPHGKQRNAVCGDAADFCDTDDCAAYFADPGKFSDPLLYNPPLKPKQRGPV